MTPWPLCWIKVSRRETSFAKSSCASKMRRAQQRRICSYQSSSSCPFCWSRHGLWNDSVKIEDVCKLNYGHWPCWTSCTKIPVRCGETRLITIHTLEHHQFSFIGTLLTFRHVFSWVIFFLCKIVHVLSLS